MWFEWHRGCEGFFSLCPCEASPGWPQESFPRQLPTIANGASLPFCQTWAATACPSEVVTDFALPTASSSLPARCSASETSCLIPAPWQSRAGWGPAVLALPAVFCSSLQLLCSASAFPWVRAGIPVLIPLPLL